MSMKADKPSSALSGRPGVAGVIQKQSSDPMDLVKWRLSLMRLAPRCGARTKSGSPCQSPAMKGRKRCRLHGGAKGSGGPLGEANGNYRHGFRSRAHLEEMRQFRELLREARELL